MGFLVRRGAAWLHRRRGAAAAILSLLVTATGAAAQAPSPTEPFRRLSGNEIRAHIVGRDVTDGAHWSEFYRPDGVLMIMELGISSAGRWAIEGDTLCTVTDEAMPRRCWQVWIAGSEVSFRLRSQDRPPPAYLRSHQVR